MLSACYCLCVYRVKNLNRCGTEDVPYVRRLVEQRVRTERGIERRTRELYPVRTLQPDESFPLADALVAECAEMRTLVARGRVSVEPVGIERVSVEPVEPVEPVVEPSPTRARKKRS